MVLYQRLSFIFAALVILLMLFSSRHRFSTPRWRRYWSWASLPLVMYPALRVYGTKSRTLYAKCGRRGFWSVHCRLQHYSIAIGSIVGGQTVEHFG